MSLVNKTLKKHFGGTRIENMEKTSNHYIELIENERKNIIKERKNIIKLITMEKTVALKHIREILKKIKKHPTYYASYKRQFENVYDTFKKNIRSILDTANKLSSSLRMDMSPSLGSDDSIPPKSLTRRKTRTPQKTLTIRKSPTRSESPSLQKTLTPSESPSLQKTLTPSKSSDIDFDRFMDLSSSQKEPSPQSPLGPFSSLSF